MARPRTLDERTPDFFAAPCVSPIAEGSLNYSIELRRALSAALKGTPLSRYEIAGRMSALLGEDVTKAQIDAWTAESKEAWRFPFEYAAALEAACDTTILQEILARKRGCRLLVGEDTLFAELALIQHRRAELAELEKKIKRQLGENKK